jgi:hypothetical protein
MEYALDEAFKRYADLVQKTLGNRREFGERLRATGILILSPDKGIDFLPSVVKQLEEQEQFRQLLAKTKARFRDQYHGTDNSWARHNVESFFRRSGFYLDVFKGKDICVERDFEKYERAFQKQEVQVRSLILLEGIDFDCPDSGMDFQTFQIRRFADAELADILGNRVNRIFYRRSVIDVQRLQDYWFIVTKGSKPCPTLLDIWSSNLSRLGRIDPEYERSDEPFGSPQQILALFPWLKDHRTGQEGWDRGVW